MIKINNLELQEISCSYTDSILRIVADIQNITLQELESYFSFNTDATIEQYVNDTLINKWYYKEFQSIGYEKTETGWHINLTLQASVIASDDLTDLYNLLQEKEDALIEIASLIDTSDTQTDKLNQAITAVNTRIDELNNVLLKRINELQQMTYNLSNSQTRLTTRVTNLELNQGGR